MKSTKNLIALRKGRNSAAQATSRQVEITDSVLADNVSRLSITNPAPVPRTISLPEEKYFRRHEADFNRWTSTGKLTFTETWTRHGTPDKPLWILSLKCSYTDYHLELTFDSCSSRKQIAKRLAVVEAIRQMYSLEVDWEEEGISEASPQFCLTSCLQHICDAEPQGDVHVAVPLPLDISPTPPLTEPGSQPNSGGGNEPTQPTTTFVGQDTAIQDGRPPDLGLAISTPQQSEAANSDDPIAFPSLSERAVKFGTIHVTPNQTADTVLATYELPLDILQTLPSNSPQILPWMQHAFVEPHFKIIAVTNTTTFHAGSVLLCASLADGLQDDPLAMEVRSAAQAVVRPHAEIDLSSANPVVLEIPFASPFEMIGTSDKAGIPCYYSTLTAVCQSPLQLPIGVSGGVDITLYAILTDKTRFSNVRDFFDPGYGPAALAVRRDRMLQATAAEAQGAAQSTTNVTNNWTVAGDNNTVTGGGDNSASSEGSLEATTSLKSAPQAGSGGRCLPLHDPLYILDVSPSMSKGSGSLTAKALTLHDVPTAMHYARVPGIEHYSWSYLNSVKGRLDSFLLTTQNLIGDKLFEIPNSPYQTCSIPLDGQIVEYPIPLALAAMCHKYFAGNITLTLRAVMTRFHEFRLRLAYFPDQPDQERTYENAHSVPCSIFDFKEGTIHSWTVPIASGFQQNPVWADRYLSLNESPHELANAYGYVSIFLETPLQVTEQVTNAVTLLPFVSAPDMQFMVTTQPKATQFVTTQASYAEAQGDVRQTIPNVDARVRLGDLVQSSRLRPITNRTGEAFALPSEVQRFNPYYDSGVVLLTARNTMLLLDVQTGDLTMRQSGKSYDFMTFMSDIFKFWCGRIRYQVRIFCDDPAAVANIVHFPDPVSGVLSGPRLVYSEADFSQTYSLRGVAAEPFYPRLNPMMVVEVPYYASTRCAVNGLSRGIPSQGTTSSYRNGQLAVFLSTVNAGQVRYRVQLFRAFSNEAAMGTYQGHRLMSLPSPDQNVYSISFTDWSTYDVGAPAPNTPSNWELTSSVFSLSHNVMHIQRFIAGEPSVPRWADTGLSNTRIEWTPTGEFRIDLLGDYRWERADSSTATGKTLYLRSGRSYMLVYCLQLVMASSATNANIIRMRGWFMIGNASATEGSINAHPWRVLLFDTTTSLPPPRTYPLMTIVRNDTRAVVSQGYFNINERLTAAEGAVRERLSDMSFALPQMNASMDEVISPGRQLNLGERLSEPAMDAGALVQPQIGESVARTLIDAVRPVGSAIQTAGSSVFSSVMGVLPSGGLPTTPMLAAAGIGAGVTTGAVLWTAGSWRQSLDRFTETTHTAVAEVIARVSPTLTSLEGVTNTLTEAAKKFLDTDLDGYHLASCGLHLYSLIRSKTWDVTLASALGVLVTTKLLNPDFLTRITGVFNELWTTLCRFWTGDATVAQAQAGGRNIAHLFPETQVDDPISRTIVTWMRGAIPLLCGGLGFAADYGKGYCRASLTMIKELFSSARSVSAVVSTSFEWIQGLVHWCLGRKDPLMESVRLQSEMRVDIEVWCTEVLKITEAYRHNAVLNDQAGAEKVHALKLQGDKLLTSTENDHQSIGVRQTMLHCYTKLAELHSKIGTLVRDGPKQDPFCLWLVGAPGVGKSTVANTILIEGLRSLGVVFDGDPVYVFERKTDYDNLWLGHPAALWDDFGCINSPEMLAKDIGTFYALKSSQTVNANMADLPSKHVIMNPKVIGVCSNHFTIKTSLIVDQEAFDRRSNLKVKVTLDPSFKRDFPDARNLSSSGPQAAALSGVNLSEKYMRFSVYESVLSVASVTGRGRGQRNLGEPGFAPHLRDLTFNQFVAYYTEKVVQWNANQEQLVALRQAAASSLSPARWLDMPAESIQEARDEAVRNSSTLGDMLQAIRNRYRQHVTEATTTLRRVARVLRQPMTHEAQPAPALASALETIAQAQTGIQPSEISEAGVADRTPENNLPPESGSAEPSASAESPAPVAGSSGTVVSTEALPQARVQLEPDDVPLTLLVPEARVTFAERARWVALTELRQSQLDRQNDDASYVPDANVQAELHVLEDRLMTHRVGHYPDTQPSRSFDWLERNASGQVSTQPETEWQVDHFPRYTEDSEQACCCKSLDQAEEELDTEALITPITYSDLRHYASSGQCVHQLISARSTWCPSHEAWTTVIPGSEPVWVAPIPFARCCAECPLRNARDAYSFFAAWEYLARGAPSGQVPQPVAHVHEPVLTSRQLSFLEKLKKKFEGMAQWLKERAPKILRALSYACTAFALLRTAQLLLFPDLFKPKQQSNILVRPNSELYLCTMEDEIESAVMQKLILWNSTLDKTRPTTSVVYYCDVRDEVRTELFNTDEVIRAINAVRLEADPQIHSSGDGPKTRSSRRAAAVRATTRAKAQFYDGGAGDSVARSLIDVCDKSLVRIGSAFAVFGRAFVCPAHFALLEEVKLMFYHGLTVQERRYNLGTAQWHQIVEGEAGMDMAVFILPDRDLDGLSTPIMKDRFNQLYDSRQFVTCPMKSAEIIGRDTRGPITIVPGSVNWKEYSVFLKYGDINEALRKIGMLPVEKSFGFACNIRQTETGMCGNVLMNRQQGKVVGMHFSGTAEVANFQVVTKNMLRTIYDRCAVRGRETPKPSDKGTKVVLREKFVPLGAVPQGKVVHMTTKTKIRPSPMYDYLEKERGPPARTPAQMSHAEDRYRGQVALESGLSHRCNPHDAFDPEVVHQVNDHMDEQTLLVVKATMQVVSRRSIQEAVCGIPGTTFRPLWLNTSPGWPYSCEKRGACSGDYLQVSDGQLMGLHPKLVARLTAADAKLRNGTVPFSPYQAFLKDENLAPGKTARLIEGCSLHFKILWRRYCSDYFLAVRAAGFDIGTAIGININGTDGDRLTRHLLSVGDKLLADDFSKFGPRLDPTLVRMCGRRCRKWYALHCGQDPDFVEHDRARACLFESVANADLVAMDTLFRVHCGSPSGNPFTVDINDDCCRQYLGIAWVSITREKAPALASLKVRDKCVKIVTYGDDSIQGVSDSIIGIYNSSTISEFFARHNLKYTNATKQAEIVPWLTLDKASLLKCQVNSTYVSKGGPYVWFLDPAMAGDIPRWIRDPCPDEQAHMQELCRTTLYHVAGQGRRAYEEMRAQLIGWYITRDQYVSLPDFETVMALRSGELDPSALAILAGTLDLSDSDMYTLGWETRVAGDC